MSDEASGPTHGQLKAWTARRDRARGLLDYTVGKGLEIGPLQTPLAVRPGANVKYVDVFDTAGTKEKYKDGP